MAVGDIINSIAEDIGYFEATKAKNGPQQHYRVKY